MARPIGFDRSVVLDRAVALFWAKGFAATSIHDLVVATGVQRGSLYAAFGDKQGLFRAALQHYGAVVSARTFQPLEEPKADLDAIEAVFRCLAAPAAAKAPGCLVTNTAVELSPHDAELRDFVGAVLDRLEQRLCPALDRARDLGQLRADLTPDDAAALLVAVAQGLRVLARAGHSVDRRLTVVAAAFASLRPATSERTNR